jgi:small subunit ribosomal protein S10e
MTTHLLSLSTAGVMVAKKDFKVKHHELNVPNLEVVKMMQSLRSQGYIRETFSWQWYYYYLTEEGIEYLRQYLHLDENVMPATLQRTNATYTTGAGGRGGGDRRRFDDKRSGPGAGFNPRYVGVCVCFFFFFFFFFV